VVPCPVPLLVPLEDGFDWSPVLLDGLLLPEEEDELGVDPSSLFLCFLLFFFFSVVVDELCVVVVVVLP
jgi:hypothetical protein